MTSWDKVKARLEETRLNRPEPTEAELAERAEREAEATEYARLREAPKVEWHKVHFHSLFEPLGEVIADAIEQFRDSGLHGYPPDAATHPSFQAIDFEGDSPGFEAWLATLTKIAEGFRAVAVMDNYAFSDEERNAAEASYQEGMKLFSLYYLHLWD